MNIKQTFLDLTKKTVPYNKEIEYLKDYLPMNILKKDPSDNLYIKIGNSNTMFASHLDTVGGDTDVNHVIEGNIIKTDGKSVLGADDKGGVVVMLYMIIKRIPGLYTFFMGEEVGCKGSRSLSTWIEKNKTDQRYSNINKVVSFDRKDTDSVITYQMGERTCSDEFADSLITEFKKGDLIFKKDTGGILTDSVHFTDLYAECTNISVGYYDQHTNRERQDIDFLEKLCIACTKVDWDNLTIKRKPGETERLSYRSSYSSYGSGSKVHNYTDWDDEYNMYGQYGYSSGGGRYTGHQDKKDAPSKFSKSDSEYITDWRGVRLKSDEAVWCEFDEVYCLKKDAIWVDLLGFYTTPDESTNPDKSLQSDNYNDNSQNTITDGKLLQINNKIIHPTFGKGMILEISTDNKKVTVDFEKNGKRQLLLSQAKIKKIV